MNKEEEELTVLIKLINIDKKLSCACINHDKMQCEFGINIRKNFKYFIKGICLTQVLVLSIVEIWPKVPELHKSVTK